MQWQVCEDVTFKKGERIVTKGAKTDAMFVLTHGNAYVQSEAENGAAPEITIDFMQASTISQSTWSMLSLKTV